MDELTRNRRKCDRFGDMGAAEPTTPGACQRLLNLTESDVTHSTYGMGPIRNAPPKLARLIHNHKDRLSLGDPMGHSQGLFMTGGSGGPLAIGYPLPAHSAPTHASTRRTAST